MRIAVFVIVGILLNFYSNTLNSLGYISWGTQLLFNGIGAGFLLYGGYLWAKLKGWHWAWMFTMLIFPVGILVLSLLKDRKQGKSKWGITGVVVFAFLVLVGAVGILGEEKLLGVTITAAISALPLAIIGGLVVFIRELIHSRKNKLDGEI